MRSSHQARNDLGQRIAFTEVAPETAPEQPTILLCLHGARVPSGPSFDLAVRGGSLLEAMAARGHAAARMDARGYGDSERPVEMDRPSTGNPIVRADAVLRDIAAVIDALRRRRRRVVLLGWATGALWAGHYASLWSDTLAGLVLYNPVYGGVDGHPSWGAGSPLEDPSRPGRFFRERFGAYRVCTPADLLEKWDRSFPGQDPDTWRDPAIARAYVEATLASDPARPRTPDGAPAFRAPSGALEDTFYAMRGRMLYDASLIRCPVLVLRCAADFLARAEEAVLLRAHLVSAPRANFVEVPGATHYAHLDRPHRGRDAVLDALGTFLDAASA